jgi:GH35 family endo-1,4-beta-xylanase
MKTYSSVSLSVFILFFIGTPLTVAVPLLSYLANSIDIKPAQLGPLNSHQFAQPTITPVVRLYGFVTDQLGVPLPQTAIDVYGDANERLAIQPTNSKGYYEFSLPRNQMYRLILSSSADRGGFQLFKHVPVTREIRPGEAPDVRTDIVLRPSGNLILNAYDVNGNLLRNTSFKAISGNNVSVTDLADLPWIYWCDAIRDSYAREHGGNLDVGIPACAVPTQTPNRLHVLWEIPDFGKVILDIDDEGRGYSVADQGGYIVLNLNYEMAKSELAALRRDYEAFRNLDYPVSSSIVDGIQSSEAHLRKAEQYLTHSPSAMSLAVVELNQSLRDALWTQEELHLQRARSDIEQNRKGSIRLRVVDSAGQPIPTATVHFQQVSHDFLFGGQPMGDWANRYLPKVAALMREAGLNYAHISADWGALEPNPGQYDWNWTDRDQNAPELLSQGFQLKGGTAFWFTRNDPSDFHNTPKYQDTLTFPDLQSNVFEHMRTLASRYRGKIDLWEFNEQNIPQSNVLNLTWDQKIELVRSAIAGMKAGNPESKALFNSIALPYDYYVMKPESTAIQAMGIPFHDYLNMLISRNISFDAIGLEFYYSGIDSGGSARPGLSLASQSRVLDQYAVFGKPIFVSELSAPSAQYPGSNWWHRPWDEATQAEFLEKFYTIAFSKPLVKEIAWSYGIIDGESFIQSGGLLDTTGKPKVAYNTLKNLIATWTTSGIGTTNENGELLISGFAGDYQLLVDDGTGSTEFSIYLAEQKNTLLTLTIPSPAPTITLPPIYIPTALASQAQSHQSKQDWTWVGIVLVAIISIGVILGKRKMVNRHK